MQDYDSDLNGGANDHLFDDGDSCPVCDKFDCDCPPEDDKPDLGHDDNAAGYGTGFETKPTDHQPVIIIDLVAVLKANLLGGRK
jgi:hypothetical protein